VDISPPFSGTKVYHSARVWRKPASAKEQVMSTSRSGTDTSGWQQLSAGARAQLRQRLADFGISGLGAEQAFSGQIVTSVTDRARVARLLIGLVGGTPRTTRLELYDWPGEYAQRFDGVD
jgi:hypothetical protein